MISHLVLYFLASLWLNPFGRSVSSSFRSCSFPARSTWESTKGRPEQHLLGRISDQRGRLRYYVWTEFYTVQAAQRPHGHSRLLFLSAQHVPVAQYAVDLPQELPYRLRRNTLYFQPRAGCEPARTYSLQLGMRLPQRLCLGEGNCYEKERTILPAFKRNR